MQPKLKDIAIYGAGGFGREVACLINRINQLQGPTWRLVGFFDDGKTIGEPVAHFGPALGGIGELNAWPDELCVVLCFGSPATLRAVRSKIVNPHITFPNLIHPDFTVTDRRTFRLGVGNIIQGGCAVTTNVALGNFNVLNGSVVMGHDVATGDCNVFMPAVRISGEVSIGYCNLFGCGSFVKQQLKIGNHVSLSPLSALLTKPKDGFTYIGNPAKIFRF